MAGAVPARYRCLSPTLACQQMPTPSEGQGGRRGDLGTLAATARVRCGESGKPPTCISWAGRSRAGRMPEPAAGREAQIPGPSSSPLTFYRSNTTFKCSRCLSCGGPVSGTRGTEGSCLMLEAAPGALRRHLRWRRPESAPGGPLEEQPGNTLGKALHPTPCGHCPGLTLHWAPSPTL